MKINNKPIYDTIAKAVKQHKEINTAVLYVPPLMVYDACMEAIDNNIKLIVIVTENVPVYDTSRLIESAKKIGKIKFKFDYESIFSRACNVGVSSPFGNCFCSERYQYFQISSA
jgi:hypothetical protein